jgi:hypothetical protein
VDKIIKANGEALHAMYRPLIAVLLAENTLKIVDATADDPTYHLEVASDKHTKYVEEIPKMRAGNRNRNLKNALTK